MTYIPLNMIGEPPLARLSDLPYLRVTGFKMFESCPLEWAIKFLGRYGDQKSKHSVIGTAAHAMMELTLRAVAAGAFAEGDDAKIKQALMAIPDEEWAAALAYQESLMSIGGKVAKIGGVDAIEHRFFLDVPGVGKQVSGQVDALFDLPDGSLLVLDHKTNREFKGAPWWRTQLQPLIYAYAMRRLFPGRVVRFCIGYVNHGKGVEWLTDPLDDAETVTRMQRAWTRMTRYDEDGSWPATIHQHCGWCPVKEKCPEHKQARMLLNTSAHMSIFEQEPDEQIEYLESVAKVCSARADALKAQILADVEAAGGVKKIGSTVYSLKQSSTRKIDASSVMEAIQEQVRQDYEAYAAMVNDILSVKVTAVDKLKKRYPTLHAQMTSAIHNVAGSTRLQSRPAATDEVVMSGLAGLLAEGDIDGS